MSRERSRRNLLQPRLSSAFGDNELVEALKQANYTDVVRQLDYFYGQVKRQILQFQSPTTGLFPRLSSDENQAFIRDSIFCAIAMWALYQAYTKRIDDDNGKAHEIGQSAVKCMRGVLFAWVRQSKEKIEQFKANQCPKHALHSKFSLSTGLSLPESGCYGHLQIDVVSLFLVTLVQMISSGLQIIYTMDEVTFVQNLVYYVERAYRTPDYGFWERGSKYHNGTPEIHASTIGMAKSALEAINGFNLFGEKGASWSVIYVDVDAHSRNISIFEALLPRESSSKNIDACLLQTISWPCFATHDDLLYNTTKNKILKKLKGQFGFKRFLKDGYGCVLENRDKELYYKPDEIKQYENIESEWPIIVCFLIIDGIFKSNDEQVKEYENLLMNRLVRRESVYGDYLLPKYYYTSFDAIEIERSEPGTTAKIASVEGSDYDCLYLMGQALLIITRLLTSCLLHISELDPIRRHLPSYNRPTRTGRYSTFQGTTNDLVVQVVLIAESMRLQAMMATYGIQTQTPHEVEPVQIWPPSQLVRVYEYLGINRKLGLKGRPSRPIGALGTSKLYRICGQTILCYPLIFEISDFYLSHDMALLIDDIKNELHFVGKYWRMSGRPTVCVLIREEHLRDQHFRELLSLLAQFKKGYLDSGLKVKTGRLQNLISSSCIEHLDFLHLLPQDDVPKMESFRQLEHTLNVGYQSLTDIPKAVAYKEPMDIDYRSRYQHSPTSEIVDALKHCDTLYAQSQLLGILWQRDGPYFCVENGLTVKDYLERLSRQAGTLRHWSVVRYCSGVLKKLVDSISPYLTSVLVHGKRITIGSFGGVEILIENPLTPKEVHSLIYNTIDDPCEAVLQQEIILYVGRLVATTPELFTGILKIRIGSLLVAIKDFIKISDKQDTKLESLAPSEIRKLLNRVLTDEDHSMDETRKIEGALCRVPRDFYDKVWEILSRVPGGIIFAGRLLEPMPTLTQMSQNELSFALLIESYLAKISSPEYRQINVELLITLHLILERNPEICLPEKVPIDLDKIIGDTIHKYQENIPHSGINRFYAESKATTASYLARTILDTLLRDTSPECKLS